MIRQLGLRVGFFHSFILSFFLGQIAAYLTGYEGLDKLDGFNITKLNISPADEPDGTNARGTVYIPNPSIMTVALV